MTMQSLAVVAFALAATANCVHMSGTDIKTVLVDSAGDTTDVEELRTENEQLKKQNAELQLRIENLELKRRNAGLENKVDVGAEPEIGGKCKGEVAQPRSTISGAGGSQATDCGSKPYWTKYHGKSNIAGTKDIPAEGQCFQLIADGDDCKPLMKPRKDASGVEHPVAWCKC